MRENRNNFTQNEKMSRARYLSILGFLASATLLSVAIFLSINQDNIDKMAMIENNNLNENTVIASIELSKNINEVLEFNSINTTETSTVNITNETNETVQSSTNSIENITQTETNQQNEEITQEEQKEEKQTNEEKNSEDSTEKPSTQFIKPVDGEIYKEYSMDSLVYSDTLQEWITHRGIDIKAEMEKEVIASADGIVKSIKNDPRYGWSIILEHKDGFCTIYTCLLNADIVKEGDEIKQGQTIGKVGNSGVFEVSDGSHLHFEMTKDGGYINPEMYIK